MPNVLASMKKPQDFFLGLIFLGVAIVIAVYSRQYDLGTTRQMGPGYLPLVIALLLGGFGILLAARSFFGDWEPAERLGISQAVLVLGGAALFGLLVRPAGLIVAALVLIIVAGFAYRPRKRLPLLVFAVLLTAGCVIVFPWLLGQQIPVLGSWFVR
ncbi:membrane protein [Agaricicola taiwanensis]|uniref:Membrane protein n=1 Tax=Agaricicola taiwanensis TaxID=591372 RepID=A0A8J2YLU0_9RHOB|nr:tripartite tricarboxylate transporter TctB family protein [Agaricicola taiwanensis]GGE51662.1 membrane protein [Agaricicola taiwanensis]